MLEFAISLPKGTVHKRENDMIMFHIDESISKTDSWLAQMNLWLCINDETTDTALLQLTKDEEFEVHIDSQREHLDEAEELKTYTPAPPQYEYGELTLHPQTEESLPTFTFTGASLDISDIGGDLINILNRLGRFGWELTHRESENTYIMKKEMTEQ